MAGRPIVDFIRQRSSYLLPGAGLDLVSAFAIVMRGVVISLFGYLLLASLFGLLVLWSGVATWGIAGYPVTFVVAGLLLVLLLASMVLYSVLAPMPLGDSASYFLRHSYQRRAGLVLRCAAGLVLSGIFLLLLVPQSLTAFRGLGLDPGFVGPWADRLLNPGTAAAAGGVGALGGLATRALMRPVPFPRSPRLPLVPPLALLLLVFAILSADFNTPASFMFELRYVWVVLLYRIRLYSLYANLTDRLTVSIATADGNLHAPNRRRRADSGSPDRCDKAALADMFPATMRAPII